MAKVTKKKEIDGLKVEITSVGYFKQNRFLREVLKPALGFIGGILPEIGEVSGDVEHVKGQLLSGLLDGEIGADGIINAVEALIDTFDDEKIEYISETVLVGATVNGTVINSIDDIDELFCGEIITFWKVVWFFIEVNFKDFFSLVKKFVSKGKEAKPKAG